MIQSYIDILLLLVILFSLWRGWYHGFVVGLFDLLSWMGSLLAAFAFYPEAAAWLGPLLGVDEPWVRPLAFISVAVLTGLLLSLVARAVLERLPSRSHTNPVNRLLGLLPGFVSGLINAAILASLLLALPLGGSLLNATRESALANRFAALTERLETALTPVFGEAISQSLHLVTIRPESDEMVQLPYIVADALPRPDLEEEMLGLVNQERARAGLAPLEADPELVQVARAHSADMYARGYFSHFTPEGLSPFDRIQVAGVPYRTAGENLAHASTLSIAHNGLMNSPGHRENILRPEFGRVGIGILDGGPRGLMITQNFRD